MATDVESLINRYLVTAGSDLGFDEVDAVVTVWRDTAREAAGDPEVELAAPFQRHYTARGTGVPANFVLALTPAKALVFKFNTRNTEHPMSLKRSQIRTLAATFGREEVSVAAWEPGRLGMSVTFEIGSGQVPCRTPRIDINPAAAVMAIALGGSFEAPSD